VPVRNRDLASRIPNETSLLQGVCHCRQSGSLDAEHVREKLLSECKGVGHCVVVCDEEPAAAALLEGMKAIACRGLGKIAHGDISVSFDQVADGFAAQHFTPECVNTDAKRGSRFLHEGFPGRTRDSV
jgi:hypothetical protein